MECKGGFWICGDIPTENRLRRAAHAVRSRFDLDDEIEVYTATADNLLSEDVAIWSDIDESGELLSLGEL